MEGKGFLERLLQVQERLNNHHPDQIRGQRNRYSLLNNEHNLVP